MPPSHATLTITVRTNLSPTIVLLTTADDEPEAPATKVAERWLRRPVPIQRRIKEG